MVFARKKLLFFFDQYFSVRLGESLYKYNKVQDNISWLRAAISLLIAYLKLEKKEVAQPPRKLFRDVFYIDTINQRNSIANILERMDKKKTLVVLYEEVNDASLMLSGMPINYHLNARSLYLSALMRLPMAIALGSVLVRKYKRQVTASHIYINLALFLAGARTFQRLLTKWKPVSVTVVNDHNLFALSIVYAATRLGIKTIYIQHAAVSAVFPKVVVNTALFEGQHSLDVYNKIGNYSKSNLLVGIPRIDGFIGYRTGKKISAKLVVGLCLKPFFPVDLIARLIAALRSCGHVDRIILRPHPGSSGAYQDTLKEKFGLALSNARLEVSTQFLQSVDMIVSCESTIILESALMKIPAIYFDDGSFFYPFDLYGFVKNGIVAGVAKAPEELPQIIDGLNTETVEKNFLNCKYYCSTVDTPYENRSLEIFLDFYARNPEPEGLG